MEIFSRLSIILLIFVVSLVQTNGVAGNFISVLPVETNLILAEPPIAALTCPNASTISPCTCWGNSFSISIDCIGWAVDEMSIENSFRELRRVNEIPADRGVDIYQFALWSTELTQFDLVPFYASRMHQLSILSNSKLTKWVTSGNPQDHGSIHVDSFSLSEARVNGDEFGDTLKYFSLEMTDFSADGLSLNLHNNNNDEFEFLPGLSAFVNLESLGLRGCNIVGRLNSSHFKVFPRLQYTNLRENKIDGIGENVFSDNVWDIYLGGNKLNENSFHPNSGIAQTGRQTVLNLQSNQITTLPSEIFQPFLDAHPKNQLYLSGNPLICDERLSWIKSRQEEFQSRVDGADCGNDPGRNVFDSDLIP